eukprot:Phypoly_transcript_09406.p1 GENE.Phypoly_transcript_09406~~Phypoly_transcript_09406.p1  ORF type:complete len:416 (+),score=52.69 Phypoly_transcript_09406:120-1367(+)
MWHLISRAIFSSFFFFLFPTSNIMRLLLIACALLSCFVFHVTSKGIELAENELELVLLEDHPLDSACLDGSPYGYYFRQGAETNKFIIFHHGGGWCYNLSLCAERSNSDLGSSTKWSNVTLTDHDVLSSDPKVNPYLYNWTLAWLFYCDGSSFTSYRPDTVKYHDKELYFRGHNNLLATAADLLKTKGLGEATDVIIGGSSAGGLATYIHVDEWASLLPNATTVRALADGGWFLDTNSFYGYSVYTPEMHYAYQMWNSSGGVNQACKEYYVGGTGEGWKCIMAEYTYPFIKTPIFMINSKYDSWQMENIYKLPCYTNLTKCNSTELADVVNYGKTFLATLPPFEKNTEDGMFVDACYTHVQTVTPDNAWTMVEVANANGQNVTMAESFNEWYNGADVKVIQTCDYPCNPTCPPAA